MPRLRLFRRAFPASLLAFAFLVVPPAGAGVQNAPNAAVDKAGSTDSVAYDIAGAGRLRMQSQRLAKLYQQLGMGINAPQAARQIESASADIDSALAGLAPQGRKPKIQRVYGRCEALWRDLHLALKAPPGPATGDRVNQLADELMIHAGKLAMLIEGEAETPVGRLLDLSSRLNMLAQRLARLYLLVQGGDRSQGVLIDLEQARKEFNTGLQELDTARENTRASREAIALAKGQWLFFELAIAQLNPTGRADGKAALHVATSSERIAEVLDVASTQYARDYADSLRLVR